MAVWSRSQSTWRCYAVGALAVVGVVTANLAWVAPSQAESLAAIRSRGRLVVGVKDNLPPLGFRAPDGQLQGLEIEIARRLARDLLERADVTDAVMLQPLLNRDRLTAVAEGRVDLAIAQVTASAARSRVVSFSIPYYRDGTALVTREAALRSPQDLAGRRVAVLINSSTERVLRYRLPTAVLVPVASYAAAYQTLQAGAAVAFAADATVLTGWVQEYPDYRLLLPLLSVEPLCIVLPKGVQHDALRRRINEILLVWQAEEWLAARAAAWGLP